ncbi:MAG: ATPase domain-containing protein [Candidatus Micrarchaeia archaeon]
MAEQRVRTGIRGLDEMLRGGIPARRHVLVCGGPGTGKTLFAVQYIYSGAKEGEKGVYITLEEEPREIIENAKAAFPGWTELDKLIEEEKMFVIKPDRHNFVNFSDMLQSFITQHGVKRAVVDSATILKMSFDDPVEFRRRLFDFLSFLRNLDCTVVLTAELSNASRERMRFGLEQFVADGVIIMYNLERGEKRLRALEVLKMRGTDHVRDLVPMKFTPNGIEVYVGEKVY